MNNDDRGNPNDPQDRQDSQYREDREGRDAEGSRGATGASQEQSSAEEKPSPPEELKPWYYQYWFFYPTIIFWPLWPILIIRSPWHNGMLSGAIAWAMLISGSYIAYQLAGGLETLDRLRAWDQTTIVTLQVVLPGILLTVITQAHWIKNRRRIMNAARTLTANPAADTTNTSETTAGATAAASRHRRARRPNRRGGRRRR